VIGRLLGGTSLAAILAFATALVAETAQPPKPAGQPPAFRTGVEVVSLTVTVTDPKTGVYLTDLDEPDFEVFEDGVKQNV